MYSQSACRSPETSAGPSERIGFIEAPEIGPPNIASSPIVPPIAIAAASPTARVSVATARTTNIRNAVITSSHTKDCPCEPDGSVTPTCAMLPSEPRRPVSERTPPGEMAGERERERHRRVEMRPGDVPDRIDHRHDHQPECDRDADVAERMC